MVNEFRFPDVGEGITEGTIQSWDIKEGEHVEEDQVLGSIETDKAVVDVPAPISGTILKLHASEGDIIKVGDILVTIDDGEAAISHKPVIKAGEEPSVAMDKESRTPAPILVSSQPVKALPRTRKIAKDLGVDISTIRPSGIHGEITENDIRNKILPKSEKKAKLKLSYDLYGKIQHISYSGIRKVIGDKLSQSLYTAPHAVAMDEADITELWELRKRQKPIAEKDGINLTLLSFVVVAVVRALKNHLTLNAHFDEGENDIIVKKYCNIGIATDTPDGLKVPVIKRADILSLFDIQKSINELTEKARNNEIDLADLQGSSFSITNYGSIGGYYGVPIINLGDVAILGVGKAKDDVKVVNGQMVIRKMMGLSVSFDHRINDGAEVARFLSDLISLLENPAEIFI